MYTFELLLRDEFLIKARTVFILYYYFQVKISFPIILSFLTISVPARRTLSNPKNGVFWVVTPCGSCKNRRFGGTWRLLHQGDKNR
jgi:hypothetical protein